MPPSFPYAFGRFDTLPSMTLEQIAPEPLARRLAGSVKPAEILFKALDLQGRLVLWHSTIGTPWGYFLFRTLQTQSRIMQNGLLRAVSADPSLVLRLPLMPWYESELKTAPKEASQAIATLVKTFKTWDAFELVVGVLVGYKQAKIRDLASPLRALAKWLGAEAEFSLELGGDADRPACPTAGETAMGLGSLLGGLARVTIQSTTYDLEARGLKLPSAAVYRASPGEAAPLKLFRWGLESGPARSKEHYPTFLAALWLALWTPLHPLFGAVRKRSDWASLHPSYRLLKLADVIQRQKIMLRTFEASAIHSFWDQLCAVLDWPTTTAVGLSATPVVLVRRLTVCVDADERGLAEKLALPW